MDRETTFAYTANCYSGEPASCTYACPFRLDLRSFLKKCAKGRWPAAYKELRRAVLFPTLVAALCPRPCEDVCQRKTVLNGDALSIGLLEQSCLNFTKKRETASYVLSPRTERVAVVGAGPAGLSLALTLAQKRFVVTVYDREAGWGGTLRSHPGFPQFDEEIALQFGAVEAFFEFGVEITDLNALAHFDAVFLSTGDHGEHFGLLGSWDRQLSCTSNPRVFLGGGLAGLSLIEGMAQSARAAAAVEAFLQSGSPTFAGEDWDRDKCARYVPHKAVSELPRVAPSDCGRYTEEEARAEAARCMQCDCAACMDACELLVRYKKRPPRIGNDVFMDGQGRNSVSSACITRQTWSCNLCGRCGSKCREGVDLRGLFQMSRTARVASARYPPAIHHYWLREMDTVASECSLVGAKEGGSAYAFFPGCRLGASNPAYVLKAYDTLRQNYDAGLLLNCCGAPAWWAGEQGRFERHIDTLRAGWESLGRPKLVTACPTCARMLAQALPQADCVSLYTLLEAQRPAHQPPFERAAVFDPCAAAGKTEERDAVRGLAEACGIAVTDYDSDGQCCGFGGHMQLADPKLHDEITAARTADSPLPYIVYCANCREVFSAGGKECAHILDLIFGLQPCGVPTLEEKRVNRLELKKKLMEQYWRGDFAAPADPWDGLRVKLEPEVQAHMERRLITLGDVRETIWRAERTDEGFSAGDGTFLANLDGGAVIYWVRYRKEADESGELFLVSSAYAHRMRAREGE